MHQQAKRPFLHLKNERFLGRKQSNKTYIIEKKAEKKAPTHKGRHSMEDCFLIKHSHFKFDGCFFKVPCIWDTSDVGKKRHLKTNGDKTPRKNATEFRDTVNNSAKGRTLCEEDCLTALSFSNAGLSRSNSRETQGNQKHETAIAQLARVATICPGA